MTTIAAIRRQLMTIRALVGAPPENYLLSDDWQEVKAFLLHTSLSFPEAHAAVQVVIARLESEQVSMRPYPKGVWIGRIPGTARYTEQAVYDALKPFMDARIYIAEQMVELAQM